jgi:NAD+ diphosphatase
MKLTFTDTPLDFAGLKRGNPDWIADQMLRSDARAVLFCGPDLALDDRGDPMVVPARRTRMLPLQSPGLIFLGLEDGAPWFAGTLEDGVAPKGPDFRLTAMQVPAHLACIMGRARSLLMWHGRRRFCSSCGGENAPSDGGTRLKCQSCGMEHFPRVDPSVTCCPGLATNVSWVARQAGRRGSTRH